MRLFLTDVQQNYKFRSFEMHKFNPKFYFEIEVGSYLLKTAQTIEELKSAFSLRHQVFFDSTIDGRGRRYDIDQFDALCDHLIIVEKTTKKVVGTYRMNNSNTEKNFYSSTEFNLQKIIESNKKCVELGRACIDQNHRKGTVISLLWRGIYTYMKNLNADILFGCSSIKKINSRQAALVLRYFENNNMIDSVYKTNPLYTFKVPMLEEFMDHYKNELSEDQNAEAQTLIPALLRSYLKYGALVTGEPAWDNDMSCVDFLTVMRVENLSAQIEKKFKN
ncbi:MAG: GNAT family N-acyltransferase [Pseudobdellovibrio sp.]